MGIARPDVAQAKPGYPGNPTAGFEARIDLATLAAAPGADRRPLSIVAIGNDGVETVLARKELIDPRRVRPLDRRRRHRSPRRAAVPACCPRCRASASATRAASTPVTRLRVADGQRGSARADPLPAHDAGARPPTSRSTPTGTSSGAAARGGSPTTRSSGTIAHATAKRLPLLVTLNGGIWADAACDVPAWDVNDRLEQDPANCQWNEKNAVMADDALSHLPGSQAAPELGRSLTFNVYARDVRRYKQRNLQQAARVLADVRARAPRPLRRRQPRSGQLPESVLRGEAVVRLQPGHAAAVPPLAGRQRPLRRASRRAGRAGPVGYRRARPLSLAEVSALAGRRSRAGATSIRRARSRARRRTGARRSADDPWTREWELFRRHLVQLHYDELARWLVDAGIPRERIWSSQGFMAPHATAQPFAVRLDSPTQELRHRRHERRGREAARRPPGRDPLRAGRRQRHPDGRPAEPVRHAARRRSALGGGRVQPRRPAPARPAARLRRRVPRRSRRCGTTARVFVSPMAWNGSNGLFAGQPGFVPYTAWLNTPFEDAAKDFMLARAGLSPRARAVDLRRGGARATPTAGRPRSARWRRGPASSR